jgi:hypothetical protein
MGYKKHFSDSLLAALYNVKIMLVICFVKWPFLLNSVVIKMSGKGGGGS